ncbi:MAG: hypothetical protein QOF83_737 [Solirubrobacteraceae bacterium]|nr:hypothetical protein [Solirubrobacteraceae bacterium]
MPYVIGRPSKFLALATTVAGLLIAAQPAAAARPRSVPQVAAQPASADASCPAVDASPLLSNFGDSSNYAPLSGGTFEGSTADWSLTDASAVDGNEPWFVVSSEDSQSLRLASGGSAVSPSFCVDNQVPSFRFFAENVRGGRRAKLSVRVDWTDAQGNTGSTPAYALHRKDYASWQLSPVFALMAGLPDGNTLSAQLVFSASRGSAWQIDDVLLDPYAK